MVKKKACIFISGTGSNLKNLINKSRDYTFPISVNLVVSNNLKAYGLKYAKKNSIPILLINPMNKLSENFILNELKNRKIHLICLAGYMKIISTRFLNQFGKKIINIHPSLLPKFKGLDTFQKVLKNKEVATGCTVHYVNKKLDSGKIISQKKFFINKSDDENSIKRKTQKLEYKSFPEAIIKIYRNC